MLDVWRELLFRKEGNAQSFECGEHDMGRAVEYNLPVDAHVQRHTFALKLPDIQPAMR